ncbi:MAG TPA: alpha/beta fold hydrolase [Gemmataceae bacterium]|nr:alpha/beta fold hydrolase [Gemmataceae bacterium]
MKQGTRLSWPLATFLLLSSYVVLCPQGAAAAAPACATQGIVFVVDGAGGFEAASRTFRETVIAEKMPLEVRVFHWTHGYCRVFADQMHATHMTRSGRHLADEVLRCHEASPGQPIYLVGHSAGCGVILRAAANLPPDTLERIVLLAPAVATDHDLRPALASACRGIDAFYSRRDWACLGVGVLLTGTTDRRWTMAAGKVGFRPIVNDPGDEMLYARLRQYPWDSSLSCVGHKGGHYGSYQPAFLRAFVLPLLN